MSTQGSKAWAETFIEAQIAGLSDREKEALRDSSVEPRTAACEVRGEGTIYVLAQRGKIVLGLDLVEEEFGTGTLTKAGVVSDWGTYGEKLEWTLQRFIHAAG